MTLKHTSQYVNFQQIPEFDVFQLVASPMIISGRNATHCCTIDSISGSADSRFILEFVSSIVFCTQEQSYREKASW